MELVVTLPIPDACLSPNSRTHWAKLAKQKKQHREWSRIAAIDAMNTARFGKPWPGAVVRAVFFHKVKRGRDGDNAIAMLKSYFDGIADAGVVNNDKSFLHTSPEFMIDKADPRVEIHLKRLEVS